MPDLGKMSLQTRMLLSFGGVFLSFTSMSLNLSHWGPGWLRAWLFPAGFALALLPLVAVMVKIYGTEESDEKEQERIE